MSVLPLVITDARSFQISTDTYNMLFIREFYSTFGWTVRTNQSLQLRILNLIRKSIIQGVQVYASEVICKFSHRYSDRGKLRLYVISVT
jgi:hypothetical protein